MFEAVKSINKMKPTEPLLIQTEDGVTANEKEKTKAIAKYFKTVFNKKVQSLPQILPTEMKTPFTGGEIKRTIMRFKNNKSPGIDRVCIELLKHSPFVKYKVIANIYNTMAKTGDHPKEITHGLLKTK